jgi:cellulose synthase/poly-beta-1,6-N-acetylglucosamine synthase-like glycosyltransferase
MLISFLHIVFLLIASIVIIPIGLLLLQIVFAVIAQYTKRNSHSPSRASRPTIAIIVPAHNEALGIPETIRSIQPQLTLQDRLVIVADNCTDDTAEVARSHGAIVLERFNQEARGKGFALDFGMQFLKENPPDIVIIIDADCVISEHLIDSISRQCALLQRPVQANYIMRFPTKGGVKQQVTEFAWLVKNTVRPLGYGYLGLPCQLMGTGMAFLWDDLSKCQLANGHLVEDMKLGLDLASLGKATYFDATVSVNSFFPTSEQGIATQRLRWEHGHLSLIFKEFPHYFRIAMQQRNGMLLAQVFDLVIPPLALLLMMTLSLWGLSLLALITLDSWVLLGIMSTVLAALGFGILIAWYWFARTIISFNTLLMAPVVLLMKIPVYLKFIVNRQVNWVRSKRDHD